MRYRCPRGGYLFSGMLLGLFRLHRVFIYYGVVNRSVTQQRIPHRNVLLLRVHCPPIFRNIGTGRLRWVLTLSVVYSLSSYIGLLFLVSE